MSKASLAIQSAVTQAPSTNKKVAKVRVKKERQPFGPKHAKMLQGYILKRLEAFSERIHKLDDDQHSSLKEIKHNTAMAFTVLKELLPKLEALPPEVAVKRSTGKAKTSFAIGQTVSLKADKRAEFAELSDDEVVNLEVLAVRHGSLSLRTSSGSKIFLPAKFVTVAE
jgi:hypothetical protein